MGVLSHFVLAVSQRLHLECVLALRVVFLHLALVHCVVQLLLQHRNLLFILTQMTLSDGSVFLKESASYQHH